MAAAELADSIGNSHWWTSYPDRAVAFIVILDDAGNAVDYEFSSNTAVSEDPDPASLIAQAKAAVKVIDF